MPFGVGTALFSAATWPLSFAMRKLASTQSQPQQSKDEAASVAAPLQITAADNELQVDAAPHADERLFAALLTHFEKPGMSPPSARIRAVVLAEQRQAEGSRLSSRALRLSAALASKGVYFPVLGLVLVSGGLRWGRVHNSCCASRKGDGIERAAS